MNLTDIGLLGPLVLTHAGTDVPLTGRQLRTILALLAVSAGSTVTTDAIMTSLWPESPPAQARKTVQVYISNLRKTLGGDDSPILSVPGGYSLASERVSVDVDQFNSLLDAADSTTEAHDAISLLSDAIDLWHGPPFADVDIVELRSEAARLEEARIVAIEKRIELRIGLGYHAEVIGELEALALEHPYRERIRAQQMLALYRSGRQADALRVYGRARDVLAEDLGLEPGRELQQLEQAVLAQSPDLDLVTSGGDTARSMTFLVTDLEDSASQWDANPEAMTTAMALHDEILHDAVVDAGGHVFRGTAEGVLAAMPDVEAAVGAATAAQSRMAEVNWPTSPLRVRMAIDVGDVEQRNDDYFGPAINRARSVMLSGHGGQVLLTEQAAALYPEAILEDLGPHQFKGVGQVWVKQLLTGAKGAEFPPLRIDQTTAASGHSGFDHTIRGYELRERLGDGDFGIVYRAYQASVGREVAIKVIRPEYANRPSFIRRFEVEAQLVAQIEHPHVVSLYDYWRDPDGAYLVMRWLRSGNLRSTLDRGPLNPPAAKRLLEQVGSALASAHRQGVLHRDIKPANILLDDEGNAYLSDFGVAARHIGSDGDPLSTSPAYVSPEEIAGSKSSQVSDLYAFGMLAFEVLTGVQPVAGEPLPSVSKLRPELSPMIDQVLQKATAANADDRYLRVDDFLRAIRQALGTDIVAAHEGADSDSDIRNPYRGLRAFQETDAEDFFGRDGLIDELVDAAMSKRLVAVVGPSGSGKSSVVRAGLVPRLRAITGDEPWFITEMFPGSYPFEELEGALARIAVDRLDGVADELRSDELGLTRVLKRVLPNDDSRLLLVIDQFEELFSLTTDQETRELFLANLVAAAEDSRGRLHVVITMRADFFHRPLAYGEFGDLMRAGLVAVAMPTRDSLALAVSRPARSVGLDLEPGLVNEIVRDVVDEPGGLPLMQHALSELFHLRRGRRLTIEDYRASGGVLGSLTKRADEIYGDLPDKGKDAAQQIFLRLVRADEASEDTRRRVRLSELYSLGLERQTVDSVLADFGGFRLLSFDRDPISRGPTVEVGHEALIREWGLLRGWVDDRRTDLLLERRLETATGEWLASERADAFLLKEGRLSQFEHFASDTDVRLTADESEFLNSSVEHAETASARAALRRRLVLATFATFAVLASALAVFALGQRNDARDASGLAEAEAERANESASIATEQRLLAENRGQTARALQLAALAESAIDDDPELAIQLALEAVATEGLIGRELNEVTSALYNTTFADRLVTKLELDLGPGFFFMVDGVAAINAAGTQGMQPTTETDPFGLFPTTVEIIQLADGAVLGTIEEPSGLSGYLWDPQTGEILTLSSSGQLTWRDGETFETTRSLQVQEGTMFLDRVGDLLSYGALTDFEAFDLQTHVLNAQTGTELFVGPPDAFLSRLSPSGDLVAVLDDFQFIRIFDVATGEVATVIPVDLIEPSAWGWSATKDEIYFGVEPFDVRHVDGRSGDLLLETNPGFFLFAFSASPDGRFVAAAGLENTVVLLDAETLEEVAILQVGGSQTLQIVWSADSSTLASTQRDGSTIVWDIGERTTSAQAIPRVSEEMIRFDFAADNQVVLVGIGGEAELRDRDSNVVRQSFDQRNVSLATRVLLSPDGTRLAVPQAETSVAIVDAVNGSTFALTATDHYQPLAFSDDGTLLLTGANHGPDGVAPTSDGYSVHDSETGAVVYSAAASPGVFKETSLGVFAPNGDLAVMAIPQELDANGEIVIFNGPFPGLLTIHDAADFAVIAEVPLPQDLVYMQFSADSSFLAALDITGVLRLFDTADLRSGAGADAEYARATIGLYEFGITPDDKLIINSADGALTARLADEDLRVAWTIETGTGPIGPVGIDDGYVWTVVDERLGQGQGDSFGLVGFPLDRDELVAYAKSKLSRELTESECKQYLALDSCADRLAS